MAVKMGLSPEDARIGTAMDGSEGKAATRRWWEWEWRCMAVEMGLLTDGALERDCSGWRYISWE